MDIQLPVDAMELAEHIDQMVLFSGDGDFRSPVEAVQRHRIRVSVTSTIASQKPMIVDELWRQVDVFTDLGELQSKLGRDPSGRPAPRHRAPQFLERATGMLHDGIAIASANRMNIAKRQIDTGSSRPLPVIDH
jgi:hypothetical protein